jgi:hypothetical protein
MAASIELWVNNNLFEKDINYTLEKLKEKTQCNIELIGDYFEDTTCSNDKDVWHLYLNEAKSIKEYFEKEGYIQLCRVNGMDEEEIWISKNNVNLWGEKFDIAGQWYSFCYFINGSKYHNFYYNQMINDIIEYSKIFESNKLIIFSDDFHQDIPEKLLKESSIDNILTDKRWKIIKDNSIILNDIEEIEEINEDINYLYYKEWKPKNDLNIKIWKEYFK